MPDSHTVEILSLIRSGESQTLEFKSTFDKACIESLVAFANAHGGSILVGVSDTPSAKFDSLALAPSRPSGQPLVDFDSRLPKASNLAGHLRQFDSQVFPPCSSFGAALGQSFSAEPSASIPERPPSLLGPRTGPDAWLWLKFNPLPFVKIRENWWFTNSFFNSNTQMLVWNL